MKLRESMENIHHDGTISKLAIQFVKATKEKDEKTQEELKGLMAATFMAMGWNRKYTIRFIDSLSAVTDHQDIEHLLSQHGIHKDDYERTQGIGEEAPFDKNITYLMNIGIPMIPKETVKGEIGNLKNYLIKKGLKIRKIKLDRQNQYNNKFVNIIVKITAISKMDREDVFDIIEPEYEAESVERI